MSKDADSELNLETPRKVHEYQILGTPPEETFDQLARFAAQICDVPYAFISFVDGDRL